MCSPKQAKKLAYAIIYDAFLDLRWPKTRDSALNFLTTDKVTLWAWVIDRDPKDIADKAKELYKNPEVIPLERKKSGRASKYSY